MCQRPAMITGSYRPEDVTFLLKPVQLAPTDIITKERMIQSGVAHYSEMISEERRPDNKYLAIFEEACRKGQDRIAAEICRLARHIADRVAEGSLEQQITVCSLVRAGVPYGVLLHRELIAIGVNSLHYGVSIIRDRGLDGNAMKYIFDRRPIGGVVFVDGWTGKGAIASELQQSWSVLTGRSSAELLVLADPSGFATMSGSHEDWLIPSGILGANVSGLISRSILNSDLIGANEFHGSVETNHLADIDVSLKFVDRITHRMEHFRELIDPVSHSVDRMELRRAALISITTIAEQCDVQNLNRIKPGIAEATRAVLRRKPEKVFIRSFHDPDLDALIHLCQQDGVELIESAALTGPYRAITLIEKLS